MTLRDKIREYPYFEATLKSIFSKSTPNLAQNKIKKKARSTLFDRKYAHLRKVLQSPNEEDPVAPKRAKLTVSTTEIDADAIDTSGNECGIGVGKIGS